jgi:hypothetical protein
MSALGFVSRVIFSSLSGVLLIASFWLGSSSVALGQQGDDIVVPEESVGDVEDSDFAFGELPVEDEPTALEGYAYDSGGRRDPFRSLLSVRRRPEATGPRPDGIPGLLIDEIDISGIWVLDDGPVAQIRSTQQDQSYLLREGDQLYDGDVVSISLEEVVFKQIVDDPTAIKPFHEVVKRLKP